MNSNTFYHKRRCRTCVNKSEDFYQLSDYLTEYDKTLGDLLLYICRIDHKISLFELPTEICGICTQQLKDAYNFSKQAQLVNEKYISHARKLKKYRNKKLSRLTETPVDFISANNTEEIDLKLFHCEEPNIPEEFIPINKILPNIKTENPVHEDEVETTQPLVLNEAEEMNEDNLETDILMICKVEEDKNEHLTENCTENNWNSKRITLAFDKPRRHNAKQITRCPICGIMYAYERNLQRHIIKFHPDKATEIFHKNEWKMFNTVFKSKPNPDKYENYYNGNKDAARIKKVLTNAERCRNYYYRRNNAAPPKKVPITTINSERCWAWRQRKKILAQGNHSDMVEI